MPPHCDKPTGHERALSRTTMGAGGDADAQHGKPNTRRQPRPGERATERRQPRHSVVVPTESDGFESEATPRTSPRLPADVQLLHVRSQATPDPTYVANGRGAELQSRVYHQVGTAG